TPTLSLQSRRGNCRLSGTVISIHRSALRSAHRRDQITFPASSPSPDLIRGLGRDPGFLGEIPRLRRSRGKFAVTPRGWASCCFIGIDRSNVLVRGATSTPVLFLCKTPANRRRARPRNASFTLPQNRR